MMKRGCSRRADGATAVRISNLCISPWASIRAIHRAHGVALRPMAIVEPKPERLHALDAVRGYALLLGIVLHATMSFIPAPTRIWIIQDSHPSVTLGILFFVIHVFRMTAFFLIAGFFAHLSFHRRGDL